MKTAHTAHMKVNLHQDSFVKEPDQDFTVVFLSNLSHRLSLNNVWSGLKMTKTICKISVSSYYSGLMELHSLFAILKALQDIVYQRKVSWRLCHYPLLLEQLFYVVKYPYMTPKFHLRHQVATILYSVTNNSLFIFSFFWLKSATSQLVLKLITIFEKW